MTVEVVMDRYGWVTIQPASERMRRRFKGKTLFLQDPSEFMASLSKEKAKSIQSGWTERVRMDHEEYAMLLGEEVL